MIERTYQQRLVVDRLVKSLEHIDKRNVALDARATMISTSSSAIVGVVTAAKFLPSSSGCGSTVEAILLGLVCCCSVVMFVYLSRVWLPSRMPSPGATDTKRLYDHFIAVDEDVAYNNALIDLSAAVDVNAQTNGSKATSVKSMIRTFQFQLAFLGLAIAWTGISSLWLTGKLQ